MQANYQKSAKEVFVDVAVRSLIGDSSSLITLAAVQHPTLPSSEEKPSRASRSSHLVASNALPSWVPNWSTGETKILSEPISSHRAHGMTFSNLKIDPSKLMLRVHGVKLDVVVATSKPLNDREFYPVSPGRDITIQTLWRDICNKDEFNLEGKYPNGDTAFFAYVQTLSDGSVTTSSWDPRSYEEIPKSEWLAQGASYVVMALGQLDDVSPALNEIAATGDHSKWSRAANGASKRRKFARTKKGYYILGPKVLEVGDIVCVLFGGKTPFCLRPWKRNYLLVGECYVHGFMDGEAINMMERGELTEEIFDIT
jgi:hypothetical protein